MVRFVNYKESSGVVCHKKAAMVWIALSGNCSSAQDCGAGCGSCGGKKTEPRKIMVLTDTPASFAIGDTVSAGYYEVNELIAACIVFGIPLVSAMLSLLIWYCASPSTVESGLSILSAGISFIAGFFIVKLIDYFFRKVFPSRITAVAPAPHTDSEIPAERIYAG